MTPDQLFLTSTISGSPKNSPHLLHTRKQNRSRDEKANALSARRTRQASLISPKLIKVINTLQKQPMIESSLFADVRFVEANHLWELTKKAVRLVTRVKTNGKHSALFALRIDVDEMKLGSGAVALDGVVGRGVDVPAFEVNSLVVEAERGVLSPDLIFVLDGECGSVAPVEEVAGDLVGIVPLFDQMFQ